MDKLAAAKLTEETNRGTLPRPPDPVQNVRMIEPNGAIYVPGDAMRSVYTVEHGAVRIYRLLANGRRQICSFEFAGDTFGFETDIKHMFFAEAIRPTAISSHHDMKSQLSNGSPPWLQTIEHAQRNVLVLGYRDPVERVAAFLWDVNARQGNSGNIELLMPRADIADYLCLSIETISRVFTFLRLKGTIRLRTPRTIEIIRPRALQFLIE